jgi:outer membrane protein OmpA-like peptidoglycan-associated protein
MRLRTPALLIVAGAVSLAGCSDQAAFSSWYQEAGGYLDEGGFGNPTMNNMLIQSGELNYTVSLNERFANDVPTQVNFEFNRYDLDAEAQRILIQQADWIRQFPEIRFRVYGHTDLVGSNGYNKSLGLRRAQTVVAFLVSRGISRSRLEAVASFGETQPIIYTQNPERRNRRTVTEVSGFVGRHPTVLNGKYAEIIHREYIASAVPPSQLEVTATATGDDAGGGQ